MKLDDWIRRAEQLIELADKTIETAKDSQYGQSATSVDGQLYSQLRSASLSFLKNCFGDDHPYYEEFAQRTGGVAKLHHVEKGRGVLVAVRDEMKGGWITTTRGLVSAEIFTDFIEMAEHLLSETYHHAAAVMIGSVLEEHLRQLGSKAGIPLTFLHKGKQAPKKADVLNADLCKANAYNAVDQKQITAWLGIRNSAAHGKYQDYTLAQVQAMSAGVTNFMARVTV